MMFPIVEACFLARRNASNVQGQGRCAALSRSVPCTAGMGNSYMIVAPSSFADIEQRAADFLN